MRWSPEEQERLYTAAFSLYEQGNYARSAELFRELVLCGALEERYWRGLASAEQMQGNYKEALHAWCLVALLCEKDPEPHFHAAECLLSLDEREEGHKALACAEERLNADESSKELRAKIEILKVV
jgi:type III secretion system low calcium response chaperone LcrH/SycD